MLARPYHFSDAKGLDAIFRGQGITDPARDSIFVVGNVGQPTGVLVYRPGALVHELSVGRDLRSRPRADALANYAIAHARAAGLKAAVWLIRGDNQPMMRFVENLGAVKQTDPGDVLYLLTL